MTAMTKTWFVLRAIRSAFCRRCIRWYSAHSDELQEASIKVGREHGVKGSIASLMVLTEFHKQRHRADFIRFPEAVASDD